MFYLIRHALSDFNEADNQLKKEHGQAYTLQLPEFVEIRRDPKWIDAGITETGRNQCLKAKESMAEIQIELVVVSPMRRALQTCDIIFSDHPSKPIIVVEPDVREVMFSSCDIGGRIKEGMKEFPHFDFTKIKDPDAWYIRSIKNEPVRQALLAKLQSEQENREERAKKIMLEYIGQNMHKNQASTLSDFAGQRRKLKELTAKYKSIAVVSHYENIFAYSETRAKNAQIITLSADKL